MFGLSKKKQSSMNVEKKPVVFSGFFAIQVMGLSDRYVYQAIPNSQLEDLNVSLYMMGALPSFNSAEEAIAWSEKNKHIFTERRLSKSYNNHLYFNDVEHPIVKESIESMTNAIKDILDFDTNHRQDMIDKFGIHLVPDEYRNLELHKQDVYDEEFTKRLNECFSEYILEYAELLDTSIDNNG